MGFGTPVVANSRASYVITAYHVDDPTEDPPLYEMPIRVEISGRGTEALNDQIAQDIYDLLDASPKIVSVEGVKNYGASQAQTA